MMKSLYSFLGLMTIFFCGVVLTAFLVWCQIDWTGPKTIRDLERIFDAKCAKMCGEIGLSEKCAQPSYMQGFEVNPKCECWYASNRDGSECIRHHSMLNEKFNK